MQTHRQDRVVAGFGAVIVVAALGAMLVFGLQVRMLPIGERTLALLDLRAAPPPPPLHPPAPTAHSRAAKNAPSPRALRNKATPVVAPPPLVVLPPPPPPVIVAPRAGAGAAASNGASSRPGPGQGAGGEGDGTGGGGDGDGEGDSPPEQIRGRLKYSDMPAEMREAGAGGSVGVRYHVETDGRVTGCVAAQSSGNAMLDRLTCQLIEQRFRFEPSRTNDGRPVRSTVVETHQWVVDRSGY